METEIAYTLIKKSKRESKRFIAMKKVIEQIAERIFNAQIITSRAFVESQWYCSLWSKDIITLYHWDPKDGFQEAERSILPFIINVIEAQAYAKSEAMSDSNIEQLKKLGLLPKGYYVVYHEYYSNGTWWFREEDLIREITILHV